MNNAISRGFCGLSNGAVEVVNFVVADSQDSDSTVYAVLSVGGMWIGESYSWRVADAYLHKFYPSNSRPLFASWEDSEVSKLTTIKAACRVTEHLMNMAAFYNAKIYLSDLA